MMDLNEKYGYWLDKALYDMETAEAMFNSGRWFYVVFTCQQAVEKLVKGLYTLYVDDNVPRIHNIKKLVRVFESRLKEPVKDDYYQLFDTLTAQYLSNRYPDFTNDAANSIDKNNCRYYSQKNKGGVQMAANFEAVTSLAKEYAEDVRRKMPVKRAVLFGSYAKGTASELSDVDVCFFLETFSGRQRVDVIVDLLSIADARKYKGIFFEPLAFPVSEIERGNPFVREILETGVEI